MSVSQPDPIGAAGRRSRRSRGRSSSGHSAGLQAATGDGSWPAANEMIQHSSTLDIHARADTVKCCIWSQATMLTTSESQRRTFGEGRTGAVSGGRLGGSADSGLRALACETFPASSGGRLVVMWWFAGAGEITMPRLPAHWVHSALYLSTGPRVALWFSYKHAQDGEVTTRYDEHLSFE